MATVAANHRDPMHGAAQGGCKSLDMHVIDRAGGVHAAPSPALTSPGIPHTLSSGTSTCSDFDIDPCTPNIPVRRRNSAGCEPLAPVCTPLKEITGEPDSPRRKALRQRAQTHPVMTRRKLKDMQLSVLLLPLAPETAATPASPAAKSKPKEKKAWRPRCQRKATPPPPTEIVKFTPSGKIFLSYEEYADATSEIRKKIRTEGARVAQQFTPTNAVRQAPMLLMKKQSPCFEYES